MSSLLLLPMWRPETNSYYNCWKHLTNCHLNSDRKSKKKYSTTCSKCCNKARKTKTSLWSLSRKTQTLYTPSSNATLNCLCLICAFWAMWEWNCLQKTLPYSWISHPIHAKNARHVSARNLDWKTLPNCILILGISEKIIVAHHILTFCCH